ncbi:MAG: helix-turn-helix domain-containing protein [Acidimicrobiales bacterium]
MADPGNLGRRVALRRQELGLSIEELGARSGMAAPYLHHVETSPTATPDAQALMNIATALETSTAYLLGGEPHQAPQHRALERPPTVTALGRHESWDLIGPSGIGRLVFDSERGPTALPIGYHTGGGDLVFATHPGTHVDHLDGQEPVGLEVDHIDEVIGESWSVLVTGRARRVTDAGELADLSALAGTKWEGSEGLHLLVLEPTEITGRRITADPS